MATPAEQTGAAGGKLQMTAQHPAIHTIATTAPSLPPEPGLHATFARDHECKCHCTVGLLAGIDLLAGEVHALVEDRQRSR